MPTATPLRKRMRSQKHEMTKGDWMWRPAAFLEIRTRWGHWYECLTLTAQPLLDNTRNIAVSRGRGKLNAPRTLLL
jgi:hypothetical protein